MSTGGRLGREERVAREPDRAELQPPGVDQRWVRIWVLDAAAQPLVPCRLVARAVAAGRARQLQAAYGAESLWWL